MDTLAPIGFHDSFRKLYPTEVKYSWWDMKTRARERNVGWRIDYFFVSENAFSMIGDAFISTEGEGSGHCPIGLLLKV